MQLVRLCCSVKQKERRRWGGRSFAYWAHDGGSDDGCDGEYVLVNQVLEVSVHHSLLNVLRRAECRRPAKKGKKYIQHCGLVKLWKEG